MHLCKVSLENSLYFRFYDELKFWMGISMLNFKILLRVFSQGIGAFVLKFWKLFELFKSLNWLDFGMNPKRD